MTDAVLGVVAARRGPAVAWGRVKGPEGDGCSARARIAAQPFVDVPSTIAETQAGRLYDLARSLAREERTNPAAEAFAAAIGAAQREHASVCLVPAVEGTVALLLHQAILAESGQPNLTEKMLRSVLDHDPGCTEATCSAHLGLALLARSRAVEALRHIDEAARWRGSRPASAGELLVNTVVRHRAGLPATEAATLSGILRRRNRLPELSWVLTVVAADAAACGDLTRALNAANEAVGSAAAASDPHRRVLLPRAQVCLSTVLSLLGRFAEAALAEIEPWLGAGRPTILTAVPDAEIPGHA